jgi:hypothetical protein
MNRRNVLKTAAVLAGTGLISVKPLEGLAAGIAVKTPALTPAEIAGIETAIGKKGSYKEAEATYTIPLPRNDLKVTLKGEPVPVSFGFGGWVSIKRSADGKTAMIMSDCVLLQEEVNPLISAAQEAGLEIGAIHNHFFYEEPRIFFMHVHGMGSPEELAKKYAKAISATKIAPQNQPPAGPPPAKTGKDIFDVDALNKIIGYEAAINGPAIKYTVGRADLKVMAMGVEMTPNIGLNTWAVFTGSMERAHIAGDVAMLESEVNNVVRTLRANNIEVVALHHHMLGDEPHIIFLHYLGTGPALELAKSFKTVLGQLGKKGGMSGMKM